MIHLETSRFNIKIIARVLLLFFRSFPRPSWKLPRIHIEENGLSERALGRHEWPVSSDQFLAKKSGRILVVNTVLIMLAGYLQPACDTSRNFSIEHQNYCASSPPFLQKVSPSILKITQNTYRGKWAEREGPGKTRVASIFWPVSREKRRENSNYKHSSYNAGWLPTTCVWYISKLLDWTSKLLHEFSSFSSEGFPVHLENY